MLCRLLCLSFLLQNDFSQIFSTNRMSPPYQASEHNFLLDLNGPVKKGRSEFDSLGLNKTLRWAKEGAQLPVMGVNEPKQTGARSARAYSAAKTQNSLNNCSLYQSWMDELTASSTCCLMSVSVWNKQQISSR
jgi:hypothetical protein